jgi:hypothetical protein
LTAPWQEWKNPVSVAKRTKQASRSAERRGRPHWIIPALLLLLALILRLLFWHATPDRDWPYSAWYKGDAVTWLAYAGAIHDDQPYELGLPLRPPGAAYLMAMLWNGEESSIPWLKAIWCLIGAVTVLLIYLALARSFSQTVALSCGVLAAASTGLMVLSTSLNNETPYLLLVVATLYLWQDLCSRPAAGKLAVWSGLHALACLIRVEHALLFAMTTIALMIIWRRGETDSGRRLAVTKRLALIATTFLLVLAPWHVKAWSALHRFNTIPPPLSSPSEAMYHNLEQSLPPLAWDAGAELERSRLPAFCRRAASVFVATTVLHRGRQEVTADDFSLLDQAFGSRPGPLPRFPFVTMYGGLNFALANNPHATGGFSLAALDQPPPLNGGAEAYPAFLVQGLPPRNLTFAYPPHLEIVNHGYARGWQWMVTNPGQALRLAGVKLQAFWAGASLGLTGYNLPLGPNGLRRRVDLVIPEPRLGVTLWRFTLLALCLVGLAGSWRSLAILPWTLLLASKVAVVILFYGYARHGATVIPVLLLLLCLAFQTMPGLSRLRRALAGSRRRSPLLLIVAALALAVAGCELVRWVRPPTVQVDGQVLAKYDSWPVDEHEDRLITVTP